MEDNYNHQTVSEAEEIRKLETAFSKKVQGDTVNTLYGTR